MNEPFDEARLDDPGCLERRDHLLRPLAEAGARVRREAGECAAVAEEIVADGLGGMRPRAVVAAGPDSRLLRAVLEPWCPVPFVAWPGSGLPGWAGGLDLVVILAPEGSGRASASAVAEAARRGCQLLVATPSGSLVAEHATSRDSHVLPVRTGDQLATAVVVLDVLHRLGLAPASDSDLVADALDEVALRCAPPRDLVTNPAKALAIALADHTPVVWGGSVLAARAARRVSEAMRRTTGRSALAGDAQHLLPVIEAAPRRDVFADPFADGEDSPARPLLLVLDDGSQDAVVREDRGRLLAAAEASGVRVETVTHETAEPIASYAALHAEGCWAAEYLALGRTRDVD